MTPGGYRNFREPPYAVYDALIVFNSCQLQYWSEKHANRMVTHVLTIQYTYFKVYDGHI